MSTSSSRSGAPRTKTTKWLGTSEDALIWCNSTDTAGLTFSTFVSLAIVYAGIVVAVVASQGDMSIANTTIIIFLVFMALWAQMRTMLGDPGAVPPNAHPLPKDADVGQIVCGRCECYKPPNSHHGTCYIVFMLVILFCERCFFRTLLQHTCHIIHHESVWSAPWCVNSLISYPQRVCHHSTCRPGIKTLHFPHGSLLSMDE